MEDRIPTPGQSGRVLITPENGSPAYYATVEMADNPVQDGTPLNKSTLLKDATCALLGLPNTATPDDAFNRLALPEGQYAVKVTVLSPGGRPMPGLTVQGLTTAAGVAAVTDSSGSVIGFTITQNPELTVGNTYEDIDGQISTTVSLTSGVLNYTTLHFTRVSTASKTYSSSKIVQFSPDVDTYSCSAIGGGTNGRTGSTATRSASGGNGGRAGAVANAANLQLPESRKISVVVGGVGGTSSVEPSISASGGQGALGGIGGYATDTSSQIRNATAGGDTTGFLYPPTDVGGAGGGGGANYRGHFADDGAGGSPGGGDGGYDATLPGGGGGGGTSNVNSDGEATVNPGGAGKAGLCGLMWTYLPDIGGVA